MADDTTPYNTFLDEGRESFLALLKETFCKLCVGRTWAKDLTKLVLLNFDVMWVVAERIFQEGWLNEI